MTTLLPMKSPVFIVGCPRSGTTLLQQMLAGHPKVAIAPETHFMRRFWSRRADYGNLSDDRNFEVLLNGIATTDEFAEMGISADKFKDSARQSARTYPLLFLRLLQMYGERVGAGVVGEKTPNHLLYLPTLLQFFPDARFIHIVRDPRAVVLSLQKLEWSKGSLADDARYWNRYALAGARYERRYGGSIMTVRYEDLTNQPETAVRRICGFLDVPYSTSMLDYHRNPGGALNLRREPWKAMVLRPIDPSAATRWRDELALEDMAAVEATAWRGMRKYAYQIGTPIPTLVRVSARAHAAYSLARSATLLRAVPKWLAIRAARARRARSSGTG